MTPDQQNRLIDLIRFQGKSLSDGLQIVGVSLHELPDKMQSVVSTIGKAALNSRPALEALEKLAEEHPNAMQELTNIAKYGGANAKDALQAMGRASQGASTNIVEHLNSLVQAGRGCASEAFDQLSAMAQRGNEAARNTLVRMSQASSQFGRYARDALQLVRQYGWQAAGAAGTAMGGATTAGAGLVAGISTGMLLGGAGVLLAAGLIGGYVWSQSGDKPVPPVHLRKVAKPTNDKALANVPYGVYVGGGYNEVIAGQLPVIFDSRTDQLVGWGTDSSKKVKDTAATFKMVLGPFKTAAETRKAFDENIVPGSQRIKPLATGTCAKFKFDGKEHYIDNALRFLK